MLSFFQRQYLKMHGTRSAVLINYVYDECMQGTDLFTVEINIPLLKNNPNVAVIDNIPTTTENIS